MTRMYLAQALPPFRVADGPAFNTFTAFQQILVNTTTPAPRIPADTLELGQEILLLADGEFSNTGTPTLGIGFRYGAATPATDLALPTAITTTTGATSWPWHAEWHGQVRAVGSAGSLNGQGFWRIGTSLTAFSSEQAIPNTLALRTLAIDTTAAQAFAPAAVWGTSNAANTIKVNRFTILVLS